MHDANEGLFLFEGMISVRALIESYSAGISDRKIERLYYDVARAEKERAEFAWLSHRAREQGFSILPTPRKELDAMAVGTTHGGVIAQATPRTFPPLTAEAVEKNGFYLFLDGIEDPYNFGFALRSAYAMGAAGVILPPRNRMNAAGIVARASAGASERMAMFLATPGDAVSIFRARGYLVVAADLRDSVSSPDADLKMPLFLLVGGEKRGISRSVLDCADLRVRIDYGRDFDQSLSAASACAMLSYEVWRQNRS